MKKKEVFRVYNMTDAQLVQTCDNLLNAAERDEVEMSLRGYSLTRRQQIKILRDDFNDFPPDAYFSSVRLEATENKNISREKLEIKLRSIFVMAANKFGVNTAKYKRFGSTDISRQTDDQLIRNAKLVHLTATSLLNELSSEGLTTTWLSELDTLRQELDNNLDQQKIAERERDIATEERVEKGNILYTELTKLASVGKDIWYSVNESKYNDYLIYDTPSIVNEDAENYKTNKEEGNSNEGEIA